MDLSPLIKSGFSRRQASTLSQSLGGGLEALPPFVPLPGGSKTYHFPVTEATGTPEWDTWFGTGEGTAVHVLGVFTAMHDETVTVRQPQMPQQEQAVADGSGAVITWGPANLAMSDWSDDNYAWLRYSDAPVEFTFVAGQSYRVFVVDYDMTDGSGVAYWLDYTNWWNDFMAHMLPPGEVSSVLDTGEGLYLIPNPIVVSHRIPTVSQFTLVNANWSATADTSDGGYLCQLNADPFINNGQAAGAAVNRDNPTRPVLGGLGGSHGAYWIITASVSDAVSATLADGDWVRFALSNTLSSGDIADARRVFRRSPDIVAGSKAEFFDGGPLVYQWALYAGMTPAATTAGGHPAGVQMIMESNKPDLSASLVLTVTAITL